MSHHSDDKPEQTPLEAAVAGLPLRSIGPAFMGGRIADIAIHPANPTTWYVAVGSGGVWKTVNAGTTWTALFEDQPSYSIGCVRIDPNHPEVIWVGTGEAVSGRHVAWGDGVYRSPDGGKSWTNMGLETAEHISEILIDPRDSNVVFVAAEGPLWSSGGERGLFKTADGGRNWNAVLTVDGDTGVTSAVFAPDDPDVIYAASYQRRRRVWSFLGGGPGSGIHRSADGGESWERMTEGLPKSDMGRIGLAVTPAAPELVYATIEAADKKERGFYRSNNRGHSWDRRNEYISGGTGPHYYQEIFASPVNPQKVYQVDVFVNVTDDGGRTFRNLEESGDKHSDNHVVWIDPNNGLHLIVGTDAGLYETYDEGQSWRHVSNLPISQFYRVAVDNSVPFTNVLGGAQDLGTLYGPTRTTQIDGVRNQDWSVTLGADGYHVAFDPDDPNISYLEWQVGNVMRHDRRTMELVDIQPQPGPDDPPERWNWDTPIVISPHRPNRIYVGSQRVWRSEDRGNSWTAISGDLTKDQNRYELATTERQVSVDALYDHEAMSLYGAITALAESPVAEDVLYVGTDDGRIHASEDGGGAWRESPAPDDLPAVAFINDLEASQHDAAGVFLVADDHKSGDYRPYLYQSVDHGRTWQSIRGDLPDGVIVWCIEQDHVNPDLLFIGAENGLYATLDRGQHWHRLTKNVPTIAFRDLAVQRRDDDLVGATFGRGFYIRDDYSPLRNVDAGALAAPGALFPVRDAWWYVPYQPMQGPDQPTLGSTAFRTENPEFGATFTYHLGADVQTAKAVRQAGEAERKDAGDSVDFPGWNELWEEHLETDPVVRLLVRDHSGEVIRSISAASKTGLHRASWDLRYPAPDPVDLSPPGFKPPWIGEPRGALVPPGDYTVELVIVTEGGLERLADPQSFAVVSVPGVEGGDSESTAQFRRDTADLARRSAGASKRLEAVRDQIRHLRAGAVEVANAPELLARVDSAARTLEELSRVLHGDPIRQRLAEADVPSIQAQVERVAEFHGSTTGPPTDTQAASIADAQARFGPLVDELNRLVEDELAQLAADLDAAGGSWTPR